MIKLMLLLKRKPGLTPEQFRDHYENVHVPLGLKYVGHLLADFRRHYPDAMMSLADGQPLGCEYDAISVYSFKHAAAFTELQKILADPQVARILTEDEAQFLDRSASRMGRCEVVEAERTIS
jgi:hypothetical protein